MLKIKQHREKAIGSTFDIAESELKSEPNFRRANPDFAYKQGGPIVRSVIALIDKEISDYTRILVRTTPFKTGYYSSAPDFHPDTIPGLSAGDIKQIIKYPMQIFQVVIFVHQSHPEDTGSVFLEGDIMLNLNKESEEYSYRGISHVDLNQGRFHWYHLQIMEQLNNNLLSEYSLPANQMHSYSSRNFHRCPLLKSNGGSRLLIRIDNPHPYYITSEQGIPEMRELTNPLASVFQIKSEQYWEKIDINT